MSGGCTVMLLVATATLHVAALAGVPTEPDSAGAPGSRPGLSGGMGVSYISAQDLVNLVNATPGATSREGEFSSVVEFFGAGSIPFSGNWALKVEYAYLMGSYTVQGLFGQTEYNYAAHMPSLLLQYVLVEEGVYNFKAGIGPGFYLGDLTQRVFIDFDPDRPVYRIPEKVFRWIRGHSLCPGANRVDFDIQRSCCICCRKGRYPAGIVSPVRQKDNHLTLCRRVLQPV